ncbi:MAG: polyprenyl synthetase family protein [Dehalococcoidia bacterium]|nr:polyprenyl synthetase family protein [Dehalococcoidia bacterium]
MTVRTLAAAIEEELVDVESQLREVGEADFPWLGELLAHVLSPAGKRARPIITLLVGKLFRYDRALHIPMAVAVELLHTASLVHDDTVDDSATRRGQGTVNELWGTDVAVLLGDYLCSTENVRVVQLFSRTLRDLAEGELREINRSFDWTQGEQPYWQRVEKKTSSLFATAAQSGAILGGASEHEVQALRDYGLALGTAFQVIDDILDFDGDPSDVGKPVGSDLLQGVLTLPTLIYLDRYAPTDRQDGPFAVLRFGQPTDDERGDLLRAAIAEVRSSSAVSDAREVAETHAARARDALSRVQSGEAPMQALNEIVDFVVDRDR